VVQIFRVIKKAAWHPLQTTFYAELRTRKFCLACNYIVHVSYFFKEILLDDIVQIVKGNTTIKT